MRETHPNVRPAHPQASGHTVSDLDTFASTPGGVWPPTVHVVGKDILRFHCVFWPAFLLAAGVPLPKRVFAHGWWTINGAKMSKSVGNVVDPFALIGTYGLDATRYFLVCGVPFGSDGDFSDDALVTLVNTNLANQLGNLAHRTLTLVQKHCEGKVPSCDARVERDRGLLDAAYALLPLCRAHADSQAVHKVCEEVAALVRMSNEYIDEQVRGAPCTTSPAEVVTPWRRTHPRHRGPCEKRTSPAWKPSSGRFSRRSAARRRSCSRWCPRLRKPYSTSSAWRRGRAQAAVPLPTTKIPGPLLHSRRRGHSNLGCQYASPNPYFLASRWLTPGGGRRGTRQQLPGRPPEGMTKRGSAASKTWKQLWRLRGTSYARSRRRRLTRMSLPTRFPDSSNSRRDFWQKPAVSTACAWRLRGLQDGGLWKTTALLSPDLPMLLASSRDRGSHAAEQRRMVPFARGRQPLVGAPHGDWLASPLSVGASQKGPGRIILPQGRNPRAESAGE